jgi:membrane-associated phospholipid phosphatase
MPPMSSFAAHRRRTFVILLAAGGFLAAVIVPWLLVTAANAISDKTLVAVFDDRVANWLTQNATTTSDLLFRVLSLFGDWLLVTVVLVATVRFAMRRDFGKLATLLAAAGGAAIINVVLAFTFRRAHSLAATDFESVAQGVSFPSGHSMVALVTYGMLTYFVIASIRLTDVKRTLSILAATAFVLLIGFSRIYLGVHSVSDVVLGFAAGSVWLAVCIFAYRRAIEDASANAPQHRAGLQATSM